MKIGNGSAFWGDDPQGAVELLKSAPDLDYLTLDYLAELSLSIMAIQKERDPNLGFARDFIDLMQQLPRGPKVITNAGGLAPHRCAEALKSALGESRKIAVVTGDNQLKLLKADPGNPLFAHADDGRSLEEVVNSLLYANAYLGASGIVEALEQGAEIVITGRVADPSLTVGAAMFHHEWSANRWNCLAGATVAGHLIECGRQATGGISTRWLSLPGLEQIGFPICEIEADGSFVLTKPAGSGGAVTLETTTEQLLYEIGDPARFLTPDVTVNLLDLELGQVDTDRVRIEEVTGSPPPSTYKVGAGYAEGFRSEAMLVIRGERAAEKAQRAGEALLAPLSLERTQIEVLGAKDPEEVVLRVAAADPNQALTEQFSKRVASLVTAGPPGVCGYATGRPAVRPIVPFWPCKIEREKVEIKVEMV